MEDKKDSFQAYLDQKNDSEITIDVRQQFHEGFSALVEALAKYDKDKPLEIVKSSPAGPLGRAEGFRVKVRGNAATTLVLMIAHLGLAANLGMAMQIGLQIAETLAEQSPDMVMGKCPDCGEIHPIPKDVAEQDGQTPGPGPKSKLN